MKIYFIENSLDYPSFLCEFVLFLNLRWSCITRKQKIWEVV